GPLRADAPVRVKRPSSLSAATLGHGAGKPCHWLNEPRSRGSWRLQGCFVAAAWLSFSGKQTDQRLFPPERFRFIPEVNPLDHSLPTTEIDHPAFAACGYEAAKFDLIRGSVPVHDGNSN